MPNITQKIKSKKRYNLSGGIFDPKVLKKSKKIANKLQKLKINSDKTQLIAKNSLSHILDIASNTSDIAQNAIINTYKILAPNKKVLKNINNQFTNINLKPKKKTKKYRRRKNYTNIWDYYNR
jgi:hypothetical protein